MSSWTAAAIPDLRGRTAVVTGANSGLGFSTALELARHGADVTLACRDAAKGAAALGRLRIELPMAHARVAALDVANLASVQSFAAAWTRDHDGLDILVNNAGVMATPFRRTVDGFEQQFGTNHLGHFALTGHLLPALLARSAARVVTVSSRVAAVGRISFDDLNGERHYNPWRAYAQSKLANLLFAFELARRADAAGASLVSAAAHPGYANTNLQSGVLRAANRVFAQPASQGALPQLYAATAPGVAGADYFGPGFMGWRGHPTRVSPPRLARDPELARRLWEESEKLTGVTVEL